MLSTHERTDFLRTVDIFAHTPGLILAELAPLLEEMEMEAGEAVFRQGDLGESLYLVVEGRLRVHDGERTLNHLGDGDVFGEMAVLDAAPRVASVTAATASRLLRLHQDSLYALMGEHIEVAQGVIRVLSRHLRDRVGDLSKLRARLEDVILPLGIALSSERDLDRLLERLLLEARSICNADAATLYLRTGDEGLRFAIMRTDSLGIALGGTTGAAIPFPALRLYDEATGEPNRSNVATCVALTGESINIADVYHSLDFDFSATRAFDERTGYRSQSSFTVPLQDHAGQVIGVLQLFNAQDPVSGQVIPFDSYHQLVVESLASQAAVALNTQMLLRRQEELLKIERDLQIGRRIQADFLPRTLPRVVGWEIAARFQPAREVAGDFYDAFALPGDRIGLLIADVVDKGVGAALFMALSRSLIRAYSESGSVLSERSDAGRASSTAAVLQAVVFTNDYIAANHGEMNMFVTLFFGVLDPAAGTLAYINGGHNAPVVLDRHGRVKTRLTPTGPAVGMLPDTRFDIGEVALQPGDLLFTFTDGVPEARDPGGAFLTEERLLALLEQATPSAETVLERISGALRDHIGEADQYDDITMLAVRRLPEAGPPAQA